jgi:hypothetical protein
VRDPQRPPARRLAALRFVAERGDLALEPLAIAAGGDQLGLDPLPPGACRGELGG